MKTQGERLEWARKRAEWKSKREFALENDIAVATYNAHERAGAPGGRLFDEETARVYARKFRVNWNWLFTGFGEPTTPEAPPAKIERVPLISWVQAGELQAPDFVTDFADAEPVYVAGLGAGDWFALEVKGDSMDRISPPGSIIIVNRREKRLVNNACYVIGDGDGSATYKRFRPDPMRFEPVSVNNAHETLYPDHEPTVIGRVRRTILDM